MFVAEARERLDRLLPVATAAGHDKSAAAEARRELHTIKGAARMLALSPIADLCHQAEEELRYPGGHTGQRLTQLLDSLAAHLDALQRGQDSDASSSTRGPGESIVSSAPIPGRSSPRLVLPRRVEWDAAAERAARLRLLAVAFGELVARLDGLARAASRAANEPHAEHALALLSTSLQALATEMETGQRRLRRLADTQLDALLELQLQPLQPFLLRLARHARELARSLGKDVEVSVTGGDVRLDRRIARELEEALLHLVRNAVAHGAQPRAHRLAQGKPSATSIRIQAHALGRRVRVQVSDDGEGIRVHQVVETAVQRGLVDAATAARLSDEERLRLLLLPGMSTREEVTGVSGRGVGLDVVSTVASRLGGEVTLLSTPGQGTTVTVEVPVARRGESVVVLRTGQVKVAVPANAARQCQWLQQDQVIERTGRAYALLGGAPLPFASLARLFGLPSNNERLLVRGVVGGEEVAIAAEAHEGEVEVLVQPLPTSARARAGWVDGLTLLPSGEPVVVLSAVRLKHAENHPTSATLASEPTAGSVRVLLVDDSFVAREMERRLLEDAGFQVVTAASAEEALSRLAESPVDCLITDVEMPGVDGFALTRQVRAMPAFVHLPIVVVSTRDRPEDRLEGLLAGADAYLTKQRLDAAELVKLLRRLGSS